MFKLLLPVLSLFFFLIHSKSFGQTPGNALQFDGVNDYVSTPLPSLLQKLDSNNFTFETWIKPKGRIFSRIFFAQLNSSNFTNISITALNEIQFYVYVNGVNHSINSVDTVLSDKWTHIAATWDAIGEITSIYINGVLQVPKTGLFQSTSGTDNAMAIGSKTGGSQYFAGEIDELRIWNNILSECEIHLHFNSSVVGNEQGLVSAYTFNKGSAGGNNSTITTLSDLTANANNGTLNNFALTGSTSNWIASGADIDFMDSDYLTISKSGNELKVNFQSASYQWVDCNNNYSVVQGETNQTFTPSKSGSYAVIVTLNPCTDTSDCFNFNFSGIDHANIYNGVFVYPNPAYDILNLAFTGSGKSIFVRIIDATGKIIREENNVNANGLQLDISGLQAGMYIVEINEDGKLSGIKLLKE